MAPAQSVLDTEAVKKPLPVRTRNPACGRSLQESQHRISPSIINPRQQL